MVVTIPSTRGHGVRGHSFLPPLEGWTVEVRGHCLREDRPKDRRVDVPCPLAHRKEDMESQQLRPQINKVWIVGHLATDTILPLVQLLPSQGLTSTAHPPSGIPWYPVLALSPSPSTRGSRPPAWGLCL